MAQNTKRKKVRRPQFQRRTEPGAPPGTLISDPSVPCGQVTAMCYDAERFEERVIKDTREIKPLLDKWPVTWIDMDGLGDASLINELGRIFGLHPLALEDVVHVHQRAKIETYGNHCFIVARMPICGNFGSTEQVSFFFGEKFVLTFQERPGGDCLNPIRSRIRSGWGRSRALRPDFLVYTLLDSIVDHYFPWIEDCGERLDGIELQLGSAKLPDLMATLHKVKRELLTIRRVMWPFRDAINALLRDPSPLVGDETRVFLRDVHDHTIQIIDLIENYRDIAAGITDVFLARVGQRTSDITKVLTIIATIFIPLTFIVGVYGMNFDTSKSPWNMPELEWYWGYPAVLAMMAGLAGGMLIFFRRKGWLGSAAGDEPVE